jgi:hypothetical protein
MPNDDPFRARVVDVQTPQPSPAAFDLRRIGPLPPNSGALRGLRSPALESALSYTSAVALGDRPAALVVTKGEPRLVEPGDEVDGTLVRAIDELGVRLTDGRRLALPGLKPNK